ncbi:MAG: ATP-binding cassette domain-containing protein [Fulvivirga sp.]
MKNIFRLSTDKSKLKVLKNISLKIDKGEKLGVIGRNGSGKSTLIKIMSGAYLPDKGGKVVRNGSSMLMSLKVGMNHELTARENIYVNGSALGLRVKEIDNRFDEIIQFAELEEFVNTKTRFFSNGMAARLAFSVAVNAGADIMFLDEVFAVGDKKFKRKAIEVLEKSWLDGRTVVMVSHNMGNLKKYCDRVLYLKNGKIEFLGDPKRAIKMYNEDNS